MQHVRKTYHKYQENNNFWDALLMVFAAIFWLFVFSFILGMLHLGYACLISSSWGGMERVQTQFLVTESAGTAQGVDVALP